MHKLTDFQIGNKVLLYSLEECKLKYWYKPWTLYQYRGKGFDIIIKDGFNTVNVNCVNYSMYSNLGNINTIRSVIKKNNESYITIEESGFNWPFQLIKEKIL